MAAGSTIVNHPLYTKWLSTWMKALDVYEGSGGFLEDDKPYLVPHPREWLDHSVQATGSDGTLGMVPNPNPSKPSPKLTMRRKLARYENLAATILDAVTASLFHQPAVRTAATEGAIIEQWWANVDGKGTGIVAALQDAFTVAGVFGHTILMLEKVDEEAVTAADVRLPRLCCYTPLDLIDWLIDDRTGELQAVKLLEPEPRTDFEPQLADQFRVRVVDATTWTLYDKAGKVIESGDHGFGRLPIAVLYARRRPLSQFIGKPVLGDPQLFIDAYNLTSEVRELLRNQTFAILNVPLGKDGDVNVEQARMGQQSGTANVLFSGEAAQFISPPGDNVQAYHEHLDRLGRMIYRLSSVPWDGDSRDAESADSRRLKRQEMVASLAKYASELTRTEETLIELVYRAVHGEQWQAKLEADQVTLRYPDTFEPPDLEALTAHVSAALGLDLGATATKELKKHTAHTLLPHAPLEVKEQITAEIDAMKVLSEEEKRQQMLDDATARMAGAFGG